MDRGMKLAKILKEINEGTFQMYHGGGKWQSAPEIRPSRAGRYEGGLGIYFTNSYDRARQYAKGGKVVQLVDIQRKFTDIEDVQIPVDDVIEFLNGIRIKNRSDIIADIQRNAERMKSDSVGAYIINNLLTNYGAGSGQVGVSVVEFLVSHGVDASLEHQSGEEYWLTVFNTKIIKNYTVISPQDVPVERYMLPIE